MTHDIPMLIEPILVPEGEYVGEVLSADTFKGRSQKGGRVFHRVRILIRLELTPELLSKLEVKEFIYEDVYFINSVTDEFGNERLRPERNSQHAEMMRALFPEHEEGTPRVVVGKRVILDIGVRKNTRIQCNENYRITVSPYEP